MKDAIQAMTLGTGLGLCRCSCKSNGPQQPQTTRYWIATSFIKISGSYLFEVLLAESVINTFAHQCHEKPSAKDAVQSMTLSHRLVQVLLRIQAILNKTKKILDSYRISIRYVVDIW